MMIFPNSVTNLVTGISAALMEYKWYMQPTQISQDHNRNKAMRVIKVTVH
jgi:hypothetical protein